MANLKPLMSSAKSDWWTPDEVLGRVRMFGGSIQLDPCAATDTDIAAVNLTADDGGLVEDWIGVGGGDEGTTFVNPPYGREIGSWVNACHEWWRAGCIDVIALVPARTDTRWFKTCWDTASAICFWEGRITFVGAEHPAPFPSALVYWGESLRRFSSVFGDVGKVVVL